MKDCPHCGCEIDLAPTKGKPRSLEQHKRYFGIVRAMFSHWPEAHPVQFSSEHELRAWLQMKAGHKEIVARIPLAGMNRERARTIVEAGIRAAGSYAWPVVHGNDLVIFKPKSIAFGKLSHLAFCALNDAVCDVIKAETGLDPEQVLLEQEKAA